MAKSTPYISTKNVQSDTQKKNTRSRTEGAEMIETLIIVPPDGGWGWLVVLTSFICNFVADGTMYTFAVFLYDISVSIGCTQAEVALAHSLQTGFYYLSAPFISALTNRFGCRVVSISGGIVSCISILVTSTTDHIIIILIVYGVGGGIGFGMMFVPSIIVIGFYFERWRAIATSIAVCGSSLGIICFPLLFTDLLVHSHWRFKFRILSAACFLCACFSVLYRPLYPVRVIAIDDRRIQFAGDKSSYSSMYVDDEREVSSFGRYHNLGYPTTADVHAKSTILLAGPRRMSSASVFVGMSGPSTSTNLKIKISNTSKSEAQSERLKTVYEDEECRENKLRSCCMRCRCRLFCKCCRRSYNIAPARPLYRDDIFYSGSLAMLPQYVMSKQSSFLKSPSYEKSVIEYHLSVTRVTTQRDIEEHYGRFMCCPESMKRTLATMLDCSLLKSPSFLLLAFSGFFTLLGLYTPFLFTAERVIVNGMDETTAYYLLSTMGIANTAGRLMSGVFLSLPKIKPVPVTYISLTICGIATMLSSLSYTMEWQLSFVCIYGSTIACVASLKSIMLVDMLGLDKLTNGFGLVLMFQGVASLTGIPLSVFLKKVTGTYDASFYYTGGAILISAVMLMPLHCVSKWEKNRENHT